MVHFSCLVSAKWNISNILKYDRFITNIHNKSSWRKIANRKNKHTQTQFPFSVSPPAASLSTPRGSVVSSNSNRKVEWPFICKQKGFTPLPALQVPPYRLKNYTSKNIYTTEHIDIYTYMNYISSSILSCIPKKNIIPPIFPPLSTQQG